MSIINVLVGLPGSGKDYYAKSKANPETDVIISSDDIREELYGSAECQDNPARVFEHMFKRTCTAVRDGKNMIYYNATNISRKRRMNLIKEFRNSLKDVDNLQIYATVVIAPFSICLERNSARDRVVPEEAMNRMYRQFNVPSTAEGFGAVFVEHNYDTTTGSQLYTKLYESENISHDNPHHTMTVGDHCYATMNYIIEHADEIRQSLSDRWFIILERAAVFHDIGKPFCKVFKNAKGEDSEVAHFYNHENVGAYDFLADDTGRNNLIIALLINLHMIFYQDAKYQERMKALYSDETWTALEWLHKADQSAH
jgi:predicted kinase